MRVFFCIKIKLQTKYDEEKKLWSGPNVQAMYNTKISNAHVILRVLENYGSKIPDQWNMRWLWDSTIMKFGWKQFVLPSICKTVVLNWSKYLELYQGIPIIKLKYITNLFLATVNSRSYSCDPCTLANNINSTLLLYE